MPYLWTKLVTLNFYFISETSNSLSVRSRSLKKVYRVKNFRANVLKFKVLPEATFLIFNGNNIIACNFPHFTAIDVEGWQVALDNNKSSTLKPEPKTYFTDNQMISCSN